MSGEEDEEELEAGGRQDEEHDILHPASHKVDILPPVADKSLCLLIPTIKQARVF